MPSGSRWVCAILVVLAPALSVAAEASAFPDDRLTGFDFLLLGYVSHSGSITEVAGSYLAGENGDGTAVAVVYGDGEAPPHATGRDSLRFTEEWRRLTVLPGQSVVLVHFAVQASDLATAIAQANALSTAPPISDLPEVLNFEP